MNTMITLSLPISWVESLKKQANKKSMEYNISINYLDLIRISLIKDYNLNAEDLGKKTLNLFNSYEEAKKESESKEAQIKAKIKTKPKSKTKTKIKAAKK